MHLWSSRSQVSYEEIEGKLFVSLPVAYFVYWTKSWYTRNFFNHYTQFNHNIVAAQFYLLNSIVNHPTWVATAAAAATFHEQSQNVNLYNYLFNDLCRHLKWILFLFTAGCANNCNQFVVICVSLLLSIQPFLNWPETENSHHLILGVYLLLMI